MYFQNFLKFVTKSHLCDNEVLSSQFFPHLSSACFRSELPQGPESIINQITFLPPPNLLPRLIRFPDRRSYRGDDSILGGRRTAGGDGSGFSDFIASRVRRRIEHNGLLPESISFRIDYFKEMSSISSHNQ
jgi:hypothetical protein